MTTVDMTTANNAEPVSLDAYLRNRSVKLAMLTKSWNEGLLTITSEELAAAKLTAENPRAATRVADLVRAARRAPPAIRLAVKELGLSAVRGTAPQLAAWGGDDEASPADELERLGRWAKGLLASKNKTAKARAEAALAVAMALLGDHPRLEPLRAVAAIGEAFGVAPPENETDQRPARRVSGLLAAGKPRQIATLARVAVLQETLIAKAHADADRQSFRAGRLEGELAEARELMASLDKSVSALRTEVASLEQARLELVRKLESAERLGAHALNDLKARYRRVFGEEMSPVAGDAKAALEITPPHPEFAVDFLATLIATIDKELQWLEEPSE